jgi:hypothetical protein
LKEFALCEALNLGYSLETTDEKELEQGLRVLRMACDDAAFAKAPINAEAIEKLAAEQANRISSLPDFAAELAKIKPKSLKVRLSPLVTRSEPKFGRKKKGDEVEFAFSYYLYLLKQRAFPKTAFKENATKGESLRLAANLNKWRIVRKANLAAETDESLSRVASLRSATNRKLMQLLDLNIPEAGRKSFSNLTKIMELVSGENAELLLDAGFEASGFPPFISIDQVNRIYPHYKVPKPKGRRRKG